MVYVNYMLLGDENGWDGWIFAFNDGIVHGPFPSRSSSTECSATGRDVQMGPRDTSSATLACQRV